MKAIVLCAGQGSRLRPLTDDRPKGMVSVGGRPILERQIELFRSVGIDDIVVVGGYRHDAIPDYGVPIRLNPDYQTTNMVYSLFAAETDLASAEAAVVSYADILYSRGVLESLIDAPHQSNVVVDLDWHAYFAQRSDDVLSDAETLRLADGQITSLGATASSVDEIQGQYIGLMKFDREGIATLTDIYRRSLASGTEIGWGRPARTAYMTDLLQELINLGNPIHAITIEGAWCEIDTLEDFELAEQRLADIEA